MDSKKTSNQGDLNSFLSTKLFVPQSRSRLVKRVSLIEKLNTYHEHKMILVSAPAGFGKTTLISQWVAQLDCQSTWLSLDEKDNDPYVFLQYLFMAMQTIDSSFGLKASRSIDTWEKQTLIASIVPLLNDISAQQNRLCLILDDYHCITSDDVHRIMSYILEHQPPQLHIILSTRADPPFSLAKMRARGNLSELRIGELCFSRQDIQSFFDSVMGLSLSDSEIEILEHRTEGWAAGLQLAAISLKGCQDTDGFIKAFSGDNRYIVDYLVEEVLQRLDRTYHDFLLKTSFLPQMSAGLCDYILGISNSQTILEDLETQNLFIIPLDNTRNWYRYHHLFADLLHQRLLQGDQVGERELRQRASLWHEKNGYFDLAVDYAITAEDYKGAANLLERVSENEWQHGIRTKLFRWFEQMPMEHIYAHPDLCLLYAWVLLDDYRHEKAEESLSAIEEIIEQSNLQEQRIEYRGELDLVELQGKVMVLRALMAAGRGDTSTILQYAEKALSLLPEDSLTWRANAYYTQGIAYSITGEIGPAMDVYTQSMSLSKSVGNLDLYFRTSYWLVARLTYAAKLKHATQKCLELFEILKENKLEQSLIGAGVYVSWGNILYERNQLDEAYQNIVKEKEIIEASHDVGHKAWYYYCMIRILSARGEFKEAEQIIDNLDQLKATSELPYSFLQLTESAKVHLWFSQKKIERVARWLQQKNLSVKDEIPITRDLEYIILARYLFIQEENSDCKYLLNSLINMHEELGRGLLIIEASLLLAKVQEREGEWEDTLDTVSRALHTGAEGDCMRVFINEGKPIAKMIETLVEERRNIPRDFALKLLAEFKINDVADYGKVTTFDSLSERELEILRLIAAGLSNKKIMEKLYISLSTVKTHLRNIYSKLGVHSRTEAVARANELHLL